jgi:hypothetical protein
MGKFTVDTQSYPLLVVTYPQEATDAEIDSYFEELYKLLPRGRVMSIIDISNVTRPTSLIRAYMAKKLDEMSKRFPHNIIGEAIVAPSLATRGLVTAHLWLRNNRYHPMKVFADKIDALKWAQKLLTDAGLKAG